MNTLWLTVGKAERLQEWIERAGALDALTNSQLADLVEEDLWVDLPLLTPASDLLAEVIERLRSKPKPQDERNE